MENNIFDLLGFDTPDVLKSEEKKKEKKPVEKKATKKAVSKGTISFPYTAHTWYGTYEITEGEKTNSFILKKVNELTPMLPSDICCLERSSTCHVVCYDRTKLIAKGTIDGVDEDTRLLRRDGTSIALPEDKVITSLDASELVKIFATDSHIPLDSYDGVIFSKKDKVILPVYASINDDIKAPEGDITVYLPSGERFTIEHDKYDSEKEVADYEPLSTTHANYTCTEIGKDTYLALILEDRYGDFSPEQRFKITDKTVISIGYQEFTPTPEDFGGKTKVTSKEIRQFLINKGRREFSVKDDISYETDKSGELIVCSILGSKKGAQPMAGLSSSSSQSIPKEFLHSLYEIARAAYPNEVLVELFYIPSRKEWFYTIPPQKVGGASTECSYDRFLESFKMSGCVKVGEFHSHGTFSAFFSPVDNVDEWSKKGVYGVIGNMDTVPTLAFRYSDGTGKFTNISTQKFTDEYLSDEAVLLNDPSNIITMYFENVVKFETERHTEEPKRWTEIRDNEVGLTYKPFERDYMRHIPNIELFEDVVVYRDRTLRSTDSDKLSLYDLYMKGVERG